MAKFSVGDWVKIIPTPDTKSDVWTSSHNKFCDKIGRIVDCNNSYDDAIFLRVSVHFNYKSSAYSGEHSAWFEDKHMIKTSRWEADREVYLNDKFEEYRRFETNIKRKRDKILKDIFTDPYEEERKKQKALEETKKALNEIREHEENNDMEGWIVGDGWYVREFDDS